MIPSLNGRFEFFPAVAEPRVPSFHQLVTQRERGRLDPVGDPQLGEDVADMDRDGRPADYQSIGDLRIVQALHD